MDFLIDTSVLRYLIKRNKIYLLNEKRYFVLNKCWGELTNFEKKILLNLKKFKICIYLKIKEEKINKLISKTDNIFINFLQNNNKIVGITMDRKIIKYSKERNINNIKKFTELKYNYFK